MSTSLARKALSIMLKSSSSSSSSSSDASFKSTSKKSKKNSTTTLTPPASLDRSSIKKYKNQLKQRHIQGSKKNVQMFGKEVGSGGNSTTSGKKSSFLMDVIRQERKAKGKILNENLKYFASVGKTTKNEGLLKKELKQRIRAKEQDSGKKEGKFAVQDANEEDNNNSRNIRQESESDDEFGDLELPWNKKKTDTKKK